MKRANSEPQKTGERLFGPIEKAVYLSRPNRFILVCRHKGEEIRTYLPNPGRLSELLFPGVTVYLEWDDNPTRKMPYTAVAVERDGLPVMLHTHRTNAAVASLIESGKIPSLKGAVIKKSEVTVGRSRFDFLLNFEGRDLLLEVKSCTLFGERIAMFPDAVTGRGRRHVEELAHLSKEGTKTAVLFLVNSTKMEAFLPEYHTDLAFAHTLYNARNDVKIMALTCGWDEALNLLPEVREIPILWDVVEREAKDRGSYLLILRLNEETSIEVGKLGTIRLEKGYYIYVGSAMKNLSKRLDRHKRLRKNLHWHIDYLRQVATVHAALPFRTTDDLECELAGVLEKLANDAVDRFGSSDCNCSSHLFFMESDPLASPPFHRFLQYYRMDRLKELVL